MPAWLYFIILMTYVPLAFYLPIHRMSNSEIIDHLKQLTTAERLAVIEAATRLIREDLSQPEANENAEDKELALAAKALLADYQLDRELTAFTSLDGRKG